MPETIVITNWTGTFENAESRKLERLNYFKSPVGVDSNGYLELITEHREAGILAFGVFQALCQAAATFPKGKRGRFEKSGGKPMSIRQVAALIRMPENTVSDALQLLVSEEVGWIKLDPNPDCLPIESHSDPTALPSESQPKPKIPQPEERRGEENRGEDYPQPEPRAREEQTGLSAPCSVEDAKSAATQSMIPAEIGEEWWHDRNSKGWTIDNHAGNPRRVTTSTWRSDLIRWGREIAQKRASRSGPNGHRAVAQTSEKKDWRLEA